jgi:hypothetical protein
LALTTRLRVAVGRRWRLRVHPPGMIANRIKERQVLAAMFSGSFDALQRSRSEWLPVVQRKVTHRVLVGK